MIRLTAAVLLVLAHAFGQAQTEDVGAFARRIAAALGESSARMTVTAREDSPTDAERFGQGLRDALRDRRVKIEADAAAEIRVTLSAQSDAALWVAEVTTAGSSETIVFRPEEPTGEGETAPPAMALIAQPFYSQAEPILDIFETAGGMYVLSADAVSIYEGSAGQWTETKRVAIPAVPSRDSRGQLRFGFDAVHVLRPGLSCTGSLSLEDGLSCRQYTQWPEGTNLAPPVAGRDYAPHYDATFLGKDASEPVALTVETGELAFRGGPSEPWRRVPGYGSAVATIEASCGGGKLLLVSGDGDATQRDFVRALSVRGEPAPVGAALEMPGVVVELRDSTLSQPAVAIVRERSTNRYVALHISALCGS